MLTSSALLYNLCSSANLDWNVGGSADGLHGLLLNHYKVIGFGVYHIGTEGIKRFHSLEAYALAMRELELVSILRLHYLKCAAPDLLGFGLNLHFKGGIISDQAVKFLSTHFNKCFWKARSYSAFPISFESSKLMQKGKVMDSI
jgi:hypothetical protein